MSNAGGVGSTLNRYSDMLAGNATYVPSSYYSIASQTVGSGGASSITFSSIPSTYTHLQIRMFAQTTNSNTDSTIIINGNSSVYRHQLYGNGSTVTANANSGDAYIIFTPGNTANTFGPAVIDILDYTNTNKNTTVRALSGRDLNGSGFVGIGSALFTGLGPVTSITLNGYSTSYAQYSTFALYGIR
jgi:hypothetical protein